MKLKMIQRISGIKTNWIILFVCLSIGCEQRERTSEGTIVCPDLMPTEFTLFFEGGFDNSRLLVILNGQEYFNDLITTDKVIELAKEFTFSSDTIKTIGIRVDNQEIQNFCPDHYIRINQENGKLKIESLADAPDYYE